MILGKSKWLADKVVSQLIGKFRKLRIYIKIILKIGKVLRIVIFGLFALIDKKFFIEESSNNNPGTIP